MVGQFWSPILGSIYIKHKAQNKDKTKRSKKKQAKIQKQSNENKNKSNSFCAPNFIAVYKKKTIKRMHGLGSKW